MCHRNSESVARTGLRSSLDEAYAGEDMGTSHARVDGSLNLCIYHFEKSSGGVRESFSVLCSHALFFSPHLLSHPKKSM